jgi:hypothetical protein
MRSRSGLTLVAITLVAIFISTYSDRSIASASRRDAFLCDAAHAWRAQYPANDDLHVVVTDVSFRGTPGQFSIGEGMVIAPIALALPGVQDVLDVRASPAPARALNVEGIRVLAWEYAGTLHRDMRYVGVALVRRARRRPVAMPESPTFASLPDSWQVDARLTAEELEEEEHQLDQCKAFHRWVEATAGEPPYTEQLLRIASHLSGARRYKQDDKIGDDVCAAIRADAFTVHQAQVVAVMALRELGAPAVGLMAADPERMYFVGTYVDGPGWVTLDMWDASEGFQLGGPPIVTLAPLAAPFEASEHSFWYVSGQAYGRAFGRVASFSGTRWTTQLSETEDVTVATARPLAEVCP